MSFPARDRPKLSSRPVVCELVGLPGAGKTTVAERVIERLRADGYRCGQRRLPATSSRLVGRFQKTAFHLMHPSHLLASFEFGVRSHPLTGATLPRIVRVANSAFALSRVRQGTCDHLVLDQGIVQALWSLTLPHGTWNQKAFDKVMRSLLIGADVSFALVYLDLDVERAAHRIHQRASNESRFDHLDPSETLQLLAATETTLRRLFERAAYLTSAPWCQIDSGGRLEDVSTRVIGFLHSLTQPPSLPGGRAHSDELRLVSRRSPTGPGLSEAGSDTPN